MLIIWWAPISLRTDRPRRLRSSSCSVSWKGSPFGDAARTHHASHLQSKID